MSDEFLRKTRERNMFGCTLEDLREELNRALRMGTSPLMLAISILSDAQEESTLGHDRESRQLINRAKWIISECLTVKPLTF
jgi:hypothetical protein